MPRRTGKKVMMKEAEKILKKDGPMTANTLRTKLLSIKKLSTMCITTDILAQYLKRRPFVVYDRLSNKTKIYTIKEE